MPPAAAAQGLGHFATLAAGTLLRAIAATRTEPRDPLT